MTLERLSQIAGALLVAVFACASAHAQTAQAPVRMRIQTAVPSASIYFELLKRIGDRVDRMSGGRVKMEMLPDGAIVPAFEILDAVDKGIVEGGYAWTHYWSGKHPAAGLFSNPMAGAGVGLDQLSHVAWIFEGGGYDLYRKLYTDILKVNVEPLFVQPMGPDPLGWFKTPDQLHRRLQEDEVPLAARHHRRDLQGDGRGRGRPARRRDRAGRAARRDRRGRVDRPGRRPEPRPADSVEALLPAGPAPVDRHRRSADQQDCLEQAAAGPAGDHAHRGDGVDDRDLHLQRVPQRAGDRAAAQRVQGRRSTTRRRTSSRSSYARPTSCSTATRRRTRSSSRCSTRSATSPRIVVPYWTKILDLYSNLGNAALAARRSASTAGGTASTK